jgi:hypothetical protein
MVKPIQMDTNIYTLRCIIECCLTFIHSVLLQ